MVSVGALNPSGRTVAIFSNAGGWVRAHRVGVSVVSTFPDAFDGSLQAALEVFVPGDGLRSSLDFDDFRGGFGTWNGTSFSAPILAAEVAAFLCTAQDIGVVDQATAVRRGWAAVTSRVPDLSP